MTEKYFTKFPSITYSGIPATDITRTPRVLERVQQNPYAFYPYHVEVHERAEQFAERYYNDPHMVWLLYLSNDTVDPYLEWPLNDQEFDEHIRVKYGSIERAISQTVRFRHNWYANQDEISPSRYDALDVKELKYWEPADEHLTPRAYRRRRADWDLCTNHLVRYEVSDGDDFVVGEPVTINITANSSGNGIVVTSNSTHLVLQHVAGTYVHSNTAPISNSSHVVARFGTANTQLSNTEVLASNIDPIEAPYWDPVAAYDEEVEKNGRRRSIVVLDSRFSSQAAADLRVSVREP